MQTIIPDFTGRRDGGPDHIKALIEYRWTLHTAHIDAWEDHQAHLEFLREEAEAMERKQEEQAAEDRYYERRGYLRSIGCNPDAPWNS